MWGRKFRQARLAVVPWVGGEGEVPLEKVVWGKKSIKILLLGNTLTCAHLGGVGCCKEKVGWPWILQIDTFPASSRFREAPAPRSPQRALHSSLHQRPGLGCWEGFSGQPVIICLPLKVYTCYEMLSVFYLSNFWDRYLIF